jgi:hypothetical protein
MAVCCCLYQATVSRQHRCSTLTGLVQYIEVQTGLDDPCRLQGCQFVWREL